MSYLRETDPEVADAIEKDLMRQKNNLLMIASENYADEAILEAQGCIMTNKYAEGYPHHRYYGGCEFVDVVEDIAIARAKKLFNAEHANVQPHSGSQANMAVYFSVLEKGDTIMGMALSHGGHLSHGASVSFSGKMFNSVQYTVSKKDEFLDYAEILELAKKHKPKMIIAGASAYSREIDFKAFREIADEVGAYLFADIAHIAGLVAAGIHQSPVPYADFVASTTHKTLRGPRGGFILCKEKYAKQIDKSVFPGIQGGPLMHVIAGKAICFKLAMEPEFKEYQKQVVKNAKKMAELFIEKGYRVVSGGTDNHLFVLDLTKKGITGKEAEDALQEAGIIVNKNTIPFETRSPFIASGIRIGTPSLTSRGMKENEMEEITEMISKILSDINNKNLRVEIKKEVLNLCKRFPIYKEMEKNI